MTTIPSRGMPRQRAIQLRPIPCCRPPTAARPGGFPAAEADGSLAPPDRESGLRAWLAATPPQPLPRYLAVELARIARNHGLTVEVERLLAASGRAVATPSKPPMTAKS